MKNVAYKEIASHSNTVLNETVPYPIVFYPGFYGTFFGFKKTKESEIFLCSCAKEAIKNYIKFRKASPIGNNSGPTRMFLLDSSVFPIQLIESLMKKNFKDDNDILNALKFEAKLCHECNTIIPEYRYCHEMYGGSFKQNFGWYINKQAYEYGIEPLEFNVLRDQCPQEILDHIIYDPFETRKKCIDLVESNPIKADALWKNLKKQNRVVWNIIENQVREKFGHKKVGECWSSETILYYIIESLFPTFKIKRHFRPQFLQGLELDIYIEEIKVAIEYQGIQHFQPVKHWGGEEAFQKLKVRDKKKKKLCEAERITLVYFNHDEGLSNESVMNKLKTILKT